MALLSVRITSSLFVTPAINVAEYGNDTISHQEHSSPHLAGGAGEKENWPNHVGSPLTRMYTIAVCL